MSEQVTYSKCAHCGKLIHAMHLNTFSVEGLPVCNSCYNDHHKIPYLVNFYVCYEYGVLDINSNRTDSMIRTVKSTRDEAEKWCETAKYKFGGTGFGYQKPDNGD